MRGHLWSMLFVAAFQHAPTIGTTPTVAFASFAPLNTDVFIADGQGHAARPLVPGPELDYNPSFSRDGRWVIFTSTRSGSADLFRIRPDGGSLERLTTDAAFDDQGAMSPDGTQIAFVSTRGGQADIWILDLSSGRYRNVTNHPAGDFRPAWSPDGQWIAFSSDRESKQPKAGFSLLQSLELFIVRADGSELQRITFGDAVAGSPSWSNDGKRLVFYETSLPELAVIRAPTGQRSTTQIATIELATRERHVLTSGPGEKWSPRWLPDGRIGYVMREPDADGGVAFVPAAQGARGEMRDPAWSPDGRQMVFDRNVDAEWPPVAPKRGLDPSFKLQRTGIFPSYSPTSTELVVNDATAGVLHNRIMRMNADGSGRAVVFGDPLRSALAPAWSPTGDRIAVALGRFFQDSQGPAIADIVTMTPDGKQVRYLTHGDANYGFPSWSPDGNRLVFRVAGANRNGLLIADAATGVTKVLTNARDNFPSWSPKGDRIAFTSNRDGDYEIYSIRTDGTDLQRLTHSPGNDGHNAWSPDGEWIAFTSTRRGFKDESALHPLNPQPSGDIYVMRADGSDVRMLTDDQFEDGTPNWAGSGSLPTRAGWLPIRRSHPRFRSIANDDEESIALR